MSKYDEYRIPKDEKKPELPEYKASYHSKKGIISDYSEELCEWVIEHGQAGFLIEGWCGKYSVCVDSMNKWLSEKDAKGNYTYPEFRSAVKISQSACLHYWCGLLNHSIQNFMVAGSMIPIIRNIISDIIKTTPTPLRDMQFDNLHTETQEQIDRRNKSQNQAGFVDALTGV